jgi:hypothetical protein
MRAPPSSSFRQALDDHRTWLPTLEPAWRRQLAQEMIERWIDRRECESIWATIVSLLKVEVTPDRFIAEIVQLRLTAEMLEIIRVSYPKKKMHKLGNRLMREEKYAELGERSTAFDNEIARFEEARIRAQRAGLFGRKDPARMYFMQQLSAGFSRWCGQWRDDEVRVLTEIAFDREISPEAVRNARRD